MMPSPVNLKTPQADLQEHIGLSEESMGRDRSIHILVPVHQHKVKHMRPCTAAHGTSCLAVYVCSDTRKVYNPHPLRIIFPSWLSPGPHRLRPPLICKRAYQSCKYMQIQREENHFNKTDVRHGVHAFKSPGYLKRDCQ